ncbi:hypothetical protein [Paenibacillus pabuli]|uniref:hypothetical protein n=1 Tax=Paenibacillus pabuli TaxID=1472 RepID=UPI000AF3DD21|nr:hypothetical protein [Paenibacillus pabuli]MEC0128264.1 hypothetical protein [Paenibacillus pabuli]
MTSAYILQQNNFDMDEQIVEINTPQGKLTGVLINHKDAVLEQELIPINDQKV